MNIIDELEAKSKECTAIPDYIRHHSIPHGRLMAIIRMLRAGERMETALNSSVYAMSNGCCQNNMTAYIRDADTALKEYQTAKESGSGLL